MHGISNIKIVKQIKDIHLPKALAAFFYRGADKSLVRPTSPMYFV